jgi:hypothetical protein
MRRLGFVKLDAYGLVLTPEDRILSVRSTVLDDGLGQKIVGWQESDLAAMELERWAPPTQAPRNVAKPVINQVALAPTVPQAAMPPPIPRAKPPTTPPALTQRPLPGMTTAPARPMAVAQPLGTAAPKQKRPPTPIPLETMPMGRVADPTEVGEDGDEWEWEIAVARARAAAEWAEEAALLIATQASAPQPRVIKKRATSPIAIVAEPKRDAMKSDIWPTTEPLQRVVAEAIEEAPPVRVMPRVKSPTPAKPIVMIPARTPAPLPPPPTGPVSTLTMLPSVSPRAPLQPIVAPRARSTTGQLPATMASTQRRFPRGTPATTPDARMDRIGEDTQVSATPAPANDDATRPGLMLPSASSTRRVAAKQR